MLASLTALAAVGLSGLAAAPAPQPVAYDGCLILRVRAHSWGLSPETRAIHITDRFTGLVCDALEARAKGKPAPQPTAARAHGEWAVVARGTVVVTVTVVDARACDSVPRKLAGIWAARMADALRVAITGGQPSASRAAAPGPRMVAQAARPAAAAPRPTLIAMLVGALRRR